MVVIHLLTSNHFSGAENVACQIIQLFKNEYDYKMIYCSPDGQIREALQKQNITFEPLARFSLKEVRRVVRKYKPDIIHAHDMRASFYATVVARNVKLISHIHNNNFDSRKLTIKAILYRLAAKHARHIFWVSNSAFNGYYYHNVYANKSSVLYNVIDVERINKLAREESSNYSADVIFLGRLTYPKDPIRLINVLKKVVSINSNTKALIVGSGEMEREVREAILANGLEENIHLMGFMTNPYIILSRSKIMIMTSRWEGLPMCALEALSLGVPIVSTPTDGLKELIVDGENGFLSNNDEELATRICCLLKDEELRSQMSKNSRKRIDELINLDDYKSTLKKSYSEK